LADQFLAGAQIDPDFSLIDQLCSLSFSDDPAIACKATRATFSVIEFLCDDFSDFGIALTSEVLVRILQYIRSTPAGSKLDSLLNDFGFTSPEILLERFKNLYKKAPISFSDRKKVIKIIVLSRVTAGADIAITSILVKRLSQTFPSASLVLIGPSHLQEMFEDVPNTRCISYIYRNDGTLFEKMTSWPELLDIAREETLGHQTGEVLLFDPDSRLSQLGLLPLIDDEHTYIFPSRASQARISDNKNLSLLANEWLNTMLAENKKVYPHLTFAAPGMSLYRNFYSAVKAGGCTFVVTINFGVGNNPAKIIEGHFEEALLKRLLETPNTVVVLDSGRGVNELKRIQHLLQVFNNAHVHTAQITDTAIDRFSKPFNHGLIAFKGPLCALGKMIDATDCFIGYDSCGQHLAAATRTPTVILFAGAPNTRFIHRWAPTNKETITIPVINEPPNNTSLLSLLNQVETAVNNLRSKTLAPV